MKILNQMAFSFDDVLLVPQYTNIGSRKDVDTSTRLTKHTGLNVPIVSANMDTITELSMLIAMHKIGGIGILHRFMSIESMESICDSFYGVTGHKPIVSVGVKKEDIKRILWLKDKVSGFCVDIAHGDSEAALLTVEFISNTCPHLSIIAGNVATDEGTRRLIEAGADCIKVGIGPGSMCTTRIVTGCGVPQLSAILECARIANGHNIPIIADGGIRNSGDIVKAIAAGASSVMLGSLIAGTDETPGEIVSDTLTGRRYKTYRGMASKDAMIGWKGDTYKDVAPEGEARIVSAKGPVETIINNLVAGLRSGMTYNNARTLKELQDNAVFVQVSTASIRENGAHGLKE